MGSPVRLLADALASCLSTVSWPISSTSVSRKNWASINPEEMTDPVIIVTPGGVDVTRIGRINWQLDYTVHVFVGRAVDTDLEIDAMIDLADQAMSAIRAHHWDVGVTWPNDVKSPQSVSIEINPDEALTERNVWRAVISATYRIIGTDAN